MAGLTPAERADFAAYVNAVDEKSHDDAFDDGVFRASRVTFNAQGHRLAPAGPTSLNRDRMIAQGMPEMNTAHQGWVPRPRQHGPTGPAYHGAWIENQNWLEVPDLRGNLPTHTTPLARTTAPGGASKNFSFSG